MRGFTLIELLVVIGIVAALSVVIVLIINPAELLRQGRDATRLSDVDILNKGLLLYSTDIGGSMGAASTTYISVPDPAATSTAGDQCQGLNLPALTAGWSYHCAAVSNYKKPDGTGWIPLIFSSLSSGSPFGSIPVDPTNQTSSNLFYTYTTDGLTYEITAIPESQKQRVAFGQNSAVNYYPGVIMNGTNLALSGLFDADNLLGYWNFDEGSGSTTVDRSGNGNNGTWAGTGAGDNGTYYTGGKVGNFAGYFDGSTNSITIPTSSLPYGAAPRSICAWANPTVLGGNRGVFVYGTGVNNELIGLIAGNTFYSVTVFGFTFPSTQFWTTGNWQQVCFVYNGTTGFEYGNGALLASSSVITVNTVSSIGTMGSYLGTRWSGFIDDVRLYGRALSTAEVRSLYNAEK